MPNSDLNIEELYNHYNRVNAGYAETYVVQVIFASGDLKTFFFNSKEQAAAFYAGAVYGSKNGAKITYLIPGVHQIDDLGGRE